MDQTAEKLKKRIEEVQGRAAIPIQFIDEFDAWEDERTEELHECPPEKESKTVHPGEFWNSLDGYLWMRAALQVPEKRDGCKTVGYFDFDSIHEGYASGFEAMLWIDGEPWQGVDENHRLVPLGEYAGRRIQMTFKLWAGITGGPKSPIYHQIRQAWLGYLDSETEDFGILAQMVLEQAEVFDEKDSRRIVLIKILDECFRQIDWISGNDGSFRQSVREAHLSLKEALKQYQDRAPFTVHCIGHTHIDLAWMWREKHTKEKTLRSFSTAMRLFDEFDEFRFFQSSPQYYAYIKENSPRLYGQIKERIREGRWEAGGAMWVEADCNLPGGESLVRQIMYGKQFLKQEFGKDTDFVWLPDAFGFPFCLPQILKKSGINTFMTSKLSWNANNRFPHDSFRWRGMDGSEVMGYFLTTPAGGFPRQEWAVTYNGSISPKALFGTYELYQEKEINSDVMTTYGHGDGGGGATRDMVEKALAMQKVPYAPKVELSLAGDFFRKVRQNAGENAKLLPVWEDELYLEYHRGTYTSQAFVKRANRKLEIRLRNLEYLQVLTAAVGRKEAECGKGAAQSAGAGSLAPYWKVLLKNQFHDILPGSSIHEVYEDAGRDYKWLRENLMAEEDAMFGGDAADTAEGWITVINTGNWTRNSFVEIPVCEPGYRWALEDGKLPEQAVVQKDRVLVRIAQLEPFGICRLRQMSELQISEALVQADTQPVLSSTDLNRCRLESDQFIITWNNKGQLTRLFDKDLGFEVFSEEPGNQLIVYEDKPLLFDAWDIDSFYTEKPYQVELEEVKEIENTALRTILRFCYKFGDSSIEQELVLKRGEKQIDFVTTADWKERQCLLKVYFPVNVKTREAVFDIQFGNIKRAATRNTNVEKARFEVCGHRFADVSQRDRGAAVLNDCKYGYDVQGGRIGLTLIKSAIDPDDRADREIHKFTYSVCPHPGAWYEGEVQKRAFELNNPVIVRKGRLLEDISRFLDVQAEYIEVDAIKPAENGDGIIMRFHEYAGGDCRVKITSPLKISSYMECSLMEEAAGERIYSDVLETAAGPYEIKTYKIWMEDER